MRRRGRHFVEYGYGNPPDQLDFDRGWQRRVIEDHVLWSQYGHPPFDLRELPAPMFEAHLAILEGQSIKHQEEADEAERDAAKAQRRANRRG